MLQNLKKIYLNINKYILENEDDIIEKIDYVYYKHSYFCLIQEMVTPIIYHSVLHYQQYTKKNRVLNIFDGSSFPTLTEINNSNDKTKVNHLVSYIKQQQTQTDNNNSLYIIENISSDEVIEVCNTIKNGIVYLHCSSDQDNDDVCNHNHSHSHDDHEQEGDGNDEEEEDYEDNEDEEIENRLNNNGFIKNLSKSFQYDDSFNVYNKYCSWILEKVVGESECCTKEIDKPKSIQYRNMMNLLDKASEQYMLKNNRKPVLIIDNINYLLNNDIHSLNLLLEFSYLHSMLNHMTIIFVYNRDIIQPQQIQLQLKREVYSPSPDESNIKTNNNINSNNSNLSNIDYLLSMIKQPYSYHCC